MLSTFTSSSSPGLLSFLLVTGLPTCCSLLFHAGTHFPPVWASPISIPSFRSQLTSWKSSAPSSPTRWHSPSMVPRKHAHPFSTVKPPSICNKWGSTFNHIKRGISLQKVSEQQCFVFVCFFVSRVTECRKKKWKVHSMQRTDLRVPNDPLIVTS